MPCRSADWSSVVSFASPGCRPVADVIHPDCWPWAQLTRPVRIVLPLLPFWSGMRT